MRVPAALSRAFDETFESLLATFLMDRKLLENPESLRNPRFLARSVVPHVLKLSERFNRLESRVDAPPPPEEKAFRETRGKRREANPSHHGPKRAVRGTPESPAAQGLDPYWGDSSNPENLRLAYFLYFMPPNLYRVASVWGELHRLGFRWNLPGPFKGIEFGAGPATGACGITAGERFAPCGLPQEGNWALIEQDGPILEMGTAWTERFFSWCDRPDWSTRPFRRRLSFAEPLLPRSAPKFHLWVMSFFLNESEESPDLWARRLIETWDRHLEQEGLAILVEPALKVQSRRMLELRRQLLERGAESGYQILLPCLGHQACGALARDGDWCHETVSWWRPPYFRKIDEMASLDRKTLPYSYLVIAKSRRPREEILPALKEGSAETTYRLVSPAHREGTDLEFYVCGQDGKRRTRFKPENKNDKHALPGRGDILLNTEIRGDERQSRIDHFSDLAGHMPDEVSAAPGGLRPLSEEEALTLDQESGYETEDEEGL